MVASGDVGVAFALVIGAGAASSVGAASVFCVSLASTRVVAASLGFAAGVMLFVCLTEILMINSRGEFVLSGASEAAAFRLTTACFFGGMALTALLDVLVHALMRVGAAHQQRRRTAKAAAAQDESSGSDKDLELACMAEAPVLACISEAPMLRQCHASEEIEPGSQAAEVAAVLQSDPHTADLLRMGIFTGLAIALHNIPEGLATFVGALSNPKAGASIAAAIAIHNVPEGICVAIPIYYATGSRWKGFIWGSLTGLAEPLGGLLGYLILHEQSPLSFAIVFGMVAGMMTYVAVKELLPSAFRFDPGDRVVSTSILVGMGVMAASLVLFTL